MKTSTSVLSALLMLWAFPHVDHAAAASCGETVESKSSVSISVSLSLSRASQAAFNLGFNLESVPFSIESLDGASGKAAPDISKTLTDLPGFVYRYPGGAIADRINLLEAVGPKRVARKLVDWAPVQALKFGPEEYAQFLSDVGGRGWLVLNVFDVSEERAAPEVLATRNAEILRKFATATAPVGVELGNEPYSHRHGLSGAEYARRLAPTLRMVQKDFPLLNPVVALLGYDRKHLKGREFNGEVLEAVRGNDVDFSLHYYYDGPPGGPPLRRALSDVCEKVEHLMQAGAPGKLWVTEHGRWPGGTVGDGGWRQRMPNSFNLDAALANADFILGLVQIPRVKGAFFHALGGATGAWRMFSRDATGALAPTPLFMGATLLAPLGGEPIRATKVSAPFKSGEPEVRAAFFDPQGGGLGAVIVHRGYAERSARLLMPEFAGQSIEVTVKTLRAQNGNGQAASPGADAGLSEARRTLRFSPKGEAELPLPARALLQISFPS